MGLISKILGDANERFLNSLEPILEKVNALGPEFEKFSDEALKAKTSELKNRLAGGEALDGLLPEAFAAVREAAERSIGQRHFDVQILGGIVLHQGKIAEMKTGEGKTLVATLPLYLNSLGGRGCHLVTPNDYLSRVGGGWMGPVYHALGVSVGVIAHDFSGLYDPSFQTSPSQGDDRLDHWRPAGRKEAYAADITYGTNNEFGFDYLRDNMAYDLDAMVQIRRPAQTSRGKTQNDSALVSVPSASFRDDQVHNFAIVDEVDSILIDEARTPLIISSPDEESAEYYKTFSRIVPELKENIDYNVDEKLKAVAITEDGIGKVERILGVENIYEEKGFRYVRYLEQALRAQALFLRDRDYVVRGGEVIIVDEFTGRLMPGRRWSEGLHQAVEAKEGVAIQRESRTLATITFQNLFRMYGKLAGMTGTAATNAEEFHKVYNMEVVTIPTARPLIRRDLSDLIFRTEHGKFLAATQEIKTRHAKGQPVLVGTVSIEKNERLSAYLKREGVSHQILNAKNHDQEALIIAQAGRLGAVTMATNIAGRGVDILLGGNPQDAEEADKVRKLGGLLVLGTERHEARRIDNQLRGRTGRQGDPGETQFYLSLEDDLMRIFGSDRIKSMMESFGIPEDQPIENRLVSKSIESAQQKIEGFNFDARKHILEFDDVMNKQRGYIYRLRREVLQESENSPDALIARLLAWMTEEVSKFVNFHAAGDYFPDWNVEEIAENVRAIAEAPPVFREEIGRIAGQDTTAQEKREELARYIVTTLNIIFDDRAKAVGQEAINNMLKTVMLRSIDLLWMDHLDTMDHLRDSVRLRAYGQRDPLVEYKNESVRLFRALQAAIRTQILNTVFKVITPEREGREAPRLTPSNLVFSSPGEAPSGNAFAAAAAGGPGAGGYGAGQAATRAGAAGPPVPKKPPVGRNDPCPCGSGKKYKKCHGK